MERSALLMAPFFDEIRIGDPLLYSVDDCRKAAEILLQRYGDKADAKKRAHGPGVKSNYYYYICIDFGNRSAVRRADAREPGANPGLFLQL